MISEYKHKNIVWIDLENPTQEEALQMVERFGIDPLVANELILPTLRPKVDYYKDYIYLILNFPAHHKGFDRHNSESIQEIDFIIGKKFIITTRYSNVDAFLEFSKAFEVQSILNKSNMSDNAGYIFFYMTQYLYKSMMNRLANIQDLLHDIENKIFSGHEKTMVIEISKLNRRILNYKESISLHKEILESFEVASRRFFGEEFDYYAHSIIGEYYKVRGELASTKEYLEELRNTNDSLLSTKQNEIMKILTVTNFIFLPLALIAGIFNMNADLPIVGSRYDFEIIITIMLAISIGMYIYFRRKKWL
ncbi:MAG TPA: CorA family divalent cation transporter [Candidatus Paceibacterota bacterium]|nr:CorA family divalent cation transporter [Candidatus Paceibacterota bacterium]